MSFFFAIRNKSGDTCASRGLDPGAIVFPFKNELGQKDCPISNQFHAPSNPSLNTDWNLASRDRPPNFSRWS
jgi:hypothetical protein